MWAAGILLAIVTGMCLSTDNHSRRVVQPSQQNKMDMGLPAAAKIPASPSLFTSAAAARTNSQTPGHTLPGRRSFSVRRTTTGSRSRQVRNQLPRVVNKRSVETPQQPGTTTDSEATDVSQLSDVGGVGEQCYATLLPSIPINAMCDSAVGSCKGLCGRFRHSPCSCHFDCHIYRTCCADFLAACFLDGEPVPSTTPTPKFQEPDFDSENPVPSVLNGESRMSTTEYANINFHPGFAFSTTKDTTSDSEEPMFWLGGHSAEPETYQQETIHTQGPPVSHPPNTHIHKPQNRSKSADEEVLKLGISTPGVLLQVPEDEAFPIFWVSSPDTNLGAPWKVTPPSVSPALVLDPQSPDYVFSTTVAAIRKTLFPLADNPPVPPVPDTSSDDDSAHSPSPQPGILLPNLLLHPSSQNNITSAPIANETPTTSIQGLPMKSNITVITSDFEQGITQSSTDTNDYSQVTKGSASYPERHKRSVSPHVTQLAKCVSYVNAMLVTSCPSDSHVPPSVVDKCLQEPLSSSLTEIMPVTDSETGIHYKNIYCLTCWTVRGSRHGEDSRAPVGHFWRAEVRIDRGSSLGLKNTLTLTDITAYMISNYLDVYWTSPPGHPYHSCGLERYSFACPPCESDTTGDIPELFRLCQSPGISYVREIDSSKVYANLYCLYCHLAHDVHQSYLTGTGTLPSRNVTSFMEERLEGAHCAIPTDSALSSSSPPATSDLTTMSITIQWDKTRSAWLLDNNARLHLWTEELMLVNPHKWSQMLCSDSGCTEVSSARHSMMADEFVSDAVPYVLAAYLCMMPTVYGTLCGTDITVLATGMTLIEFRFKLEYMVLNTLVSRLPKDLRDTLKYTNVSTRPSSPHNGLLVTVTLGIPSLLEFTRPEFDLAEIHTHIHEQIVISGLGAVKKLAKVCIYQRLFNVDPSLLAERRCDPDPDLKLSALDSGVHGAVLWSRWLFVAVLWGLLV